MNSLELNRSAWDIMQDEASLRDNTYPGRIAIMGLSCEGDQLIQAYALMGRSEPSKNRIFVKEAFTTVRAIAPNLTVEEMAKVKDADLIYYKAMQEDSGVYVVSNGAQTEHVLDSMVGGLSLADAVEAAPTVKGSDKDIDLSSYEPDKPNNTSRITGAVDVRPDAVTPFGLTVVRKLPNSEEPLRTTWTAPSLDALKAGIGYGVQTYKGDGDPLPPYTADPFNFYLGEGSEDTAARFWEHLNPDKRVAVAVKTIDLNTASEDHSDIDIAIIIR